MMSILHIDLVVTQGLKVYAGFRGLILFAGLFYIIFHLLQEIYPFFTVRWDFICIFA